MVFLFYVRKTLFFPYVLFRTYHDFVVFTELPFNLYGIYKQKFILHDQYTYQYRLLFTIFYKIFKLFHSIQKTTTTTINVSMYNTYTHPPYKSLYIGRKIQIDFKNFSNFFIKNSPKYFPKIYWQFF